MQSTQTSLISYIKKSMKLNDLKREFVLQPWDRAYDEVIKPLPYLHFNVDMNNSVYIFIRDVTEQMTQAIYEISKTKTSERPNI